MPFDTTSFTAQLVGTIVGSYLASLTAQSVSRLTGHLNQPLQGLICLVTSFGIAVLTHGPVSWTCLSKVPHGIAALTRSPNQNSIDEQGEDLEPVVNHPQTPVSTSEKKNESEILLSMGESGGNEQTIRQSQALQAATHVPATVHHANETTIAVSKGEKKKKQEKLGSGMIKQPSAPVTNIAGQTATAASSKSKKKKKKQEKHGSEPVQDISGSAIVNEDQPAATLSKSQKRKRQKQRASEGLHQRSSNTGIVLI